MAGYKTSSPVKPRAVGGADKRSISYPDKVKQRAYLGGGGKILFGKIKFPKLIFFIFMETDKLFPRSS